MYHVRKESFVLEGLYVLDKSIPENAKEAGALVGT